MDELSLLLKMSDVMTRTKQYGDHGSCVLGMELRWNGRTVASQIAQGSSTNYQYFNDIKEAAKAIGIEDAFTIEHGRMD
jgi:hypothetical protein